MAASQRYITFDSLDSNRALQGAVTKRIGPLVELAYRDYPTAVAELASVNPSDMVAQLRDTLKKQTILDCKLSTRLAPNNIEFIKSFQTEDETNDDRWVTFCKRLQNAASKQGLSDSLQRR